MVTSTKSCVNSGHCGSSSNVRHNAGSHCGQPLWAVQAVRPTEIAAFLAALGAVPSHPCCRWDGSTSGLGERCAPTVNRARSENWEFRDESRSVTRQPAHLPAAWISIRLSLHRVRQYISQSGTFRYTLGYTVNCTTFASTFLRSLDCQDPPLPPLGRDTSDDVGRIRKQLLELACESSRGSTCKTQACTNLRRQILINDASRG